MRGDAIDELSARHEEKFVGHVSQDAELVRDQQNGFAFRTHAGQQLDDVSGGVGIDVGERLVEEQQRRLVEDGASERESLAHALRVLSYTALQTRVKPDSADGALKRRVRANAVKLGEKAEVLHAGEVFVKQGRMGHVAHFRTCIFMVLAEHQDAAFGGLVEAGDDSQQGGFPGAVFAAQDVEAARIKFKADVPDRGGAAVNFGDVLNPDGNGGGSQREPQ